LPSSSETDNCRRFSSLVRRLASCDSEAIQEDAAYYLVTCIQQDRTHNGGYLVAKPIDINLTNPEAHLSATLDFETLFVRGTGVGINWLC